MTPRRDALIAPSILGADFLELGTAIRACERAGADLIHCDVMDGRFVPAISYGAMICAAAADASQIPLDVHLMVEDVAGQVEQILPLRPRYLTFHVEAVADPLAMAATIRAGGSRPGLAIKPGTPLSKIYQIAPEFDLILVMTVEPGAGGQAFMPECLPKVAAAAAARRETGSKFLIEVDGGVGSATIRQCADSGADVFVAGSAVFGHQGGVAAAVSELRVLAATE
ncbi:MAG: ribulose-phosphate 3-epimerase [Chloroflexi bacterium]|nr:ribulose-phosphate 3-epimerase [Chloroflexota bacterium]MXW29004.1 ribulose-phosphate 3-epimerase [Chloroflexota bacterium]MXX67147.1 ribulose-phosphate 3-epimerase [Chloroflexota bacterium]MXY01124.1 ribulose-phosphate 3-epimerase [Chloroflexota bacterium]MXY12886.1 ribulose-phosphate 3-epimerase [Chloroflexota bacterium]